MNGMGPLPDGGRVAIVGGGPAGVSCGLFLQRLAVEMGRQLHITILEGKQFSGAHQHNLCVGVLSPPLQAVLSEHLNVNLPSGLEGREIVGYVLHSPGAQVVLDDGQQRSVAVRRIQFDEAMLEVARERGLDLIRARAVDVDIHDGRVVIYTENRPIEADVVVGAFGMDEGSASLFARACGYKPPRALSSVVTRLYPRGGDPPRFGSHIHAFLRPHPQVEFGAITPKDDHLTVNVAGHMVSDDDLADFMCWPEVRRVLPAAVAGNVLGTPGLPMYKGRFPCSLAGRYFGDRFVMVGDAAGLVRAFKGKGVTSAVVTGLRAADTIMHAGISAEAFSSHYARANRDIIGDLFYGQSVRVMVRLCARLGLLDAVLRAARRNPSLRDSLFGAVSAHSPYRQVLAGLLRPASMQAVLAAIATR